MELAILISSNFLLMNSWSLLGCMLMFILLTKVTLYPESIKSDSRSNDYF